MEWNFWLAWLCAMDVLAVRWDSFAIDTCRILFVFGCGSESVSALAPTCCACWIETHFPEVFRERYACQILSGSGLLPLNMSVVYFSTFCHPKPGIAHDSVRQEDYALELQLDQELGAGWKPAIFCDVWTWMDLDDQTGLNILHHIATPKSGWFWMVMIGW